jgi:hypothetical protein
MPNSGTLRKLVWSLIAIVFAPAAALACPACFLAAQAGGLGDHYVRRIILISAPFLMIGFVAATIYLANRRRTPAPAARKRAVAVDSLVFERET